MSKLKIEIKSNEGILSTKKNMFIVKYIDDSTSICLNILKNKNKYFPQSVEVIKTKHWYKKMVNFCKTIGYDECDLKYILDEAISKYKKTSLDYRIDELHNKIDKLINKKSNNKKDLSRIAYNENYCENDNKNIEKNEIDKSSENCFSYGDYICYNCNTRHVVKFDIEDKQQLKNTGCLYKEYLCPKCGISNNIEFIKDDIHDFSLDDEDIIETSPTNTEYTCERKNKKPILGDDAELILEMWKTSTARQISEQFPMYSISQISRYCRKHSTFRKR